VKFWNVARSSPGLGAQASGLRGPSLSRGGFDCTSKRSLSPAGRPCKRPPLTNAPFPPRSGDSQLVCRVSNLSRAVSLDVAIYGRAGARNFGPNSTLSNRKPSHNRASAPVFAPKSEAVWHLHDTGANNRSQMRQLQAVAQTNAMSGVLRTEAQALLGDTLHSTPYTGHQHPRPAFPLFSTVSLFRDPGSHSGHRLPCSRDGCLHKRQPFVPQRILSCHKDQVLWQLIQVP